MAGSHLKTLDNHRVHTLAVAVNAITFVFLGSSERISPMQAKLVRNCLPL